MIEFLTGAAIATTAMSGSAFYLWHGWRRETDNHGTTFAHLAAANDAVSIVQGRAESMSRGLQYTNGRIIALTSERDAVQGHLTAALDHIIALEPLADKGRKLVARRHAQDVARKAARAKK